MCFIKYFIYPRYNGYKLKVLNIILFYKDYKIDLKLIINYLIIKKNTNNIQYKQQSHKSNNVQHYQGKIIRC